MTSIELKKNLERKNSPKRPKPRKIQLNFYIMKMNSRHMTVDSDLKGSIEKTVAKE
jgi:hypothetical protein